MLKRYKVLDMSEPIVRISRGITARRGHQGLYLPMEYWAYGEKLK